MSAYGPKRTWLQFTGIKRLVGSSHSIRPKHEAYTESQKNYDDRRIYHHHGIKLHKACCTPCFGIPMKTRNTAARIKTRPIAASPSISSIGFPYRVEAEINVRHRIRGRAVPPERGCPARCGLPHPLLLALTASPVLQMGPRPSLVDTRCREQTTSGKLGGTKVVQLY